MFVIYFYMLSIQWKKKRKLFNEIRQDNNDAIKLSGYNYKISLKVKVKRRNSLEKEKWYGLTHQTANP